MRKFHAYKWNDWKRDLTMMVLTEQDVENRVEWRGVGLNIVIVPNKYKDVPHDYLDLIRVTTLARGGEIIYV
jgi:hypothetical protein